jgi:hypothetical protein
VLRLTTAPVVRFCPTPSRVSVVSLYRPGFFCTIVRVVEAVNVGSKPAWATLSDSWAMVVE